MRLKQPVLALAILILSGLVAVTSCTKNGTSKLIVCGWDEVYILSLESLEDSTGKIIWSWKAEDSPELPDTMREKFSTTDECKPVDGGRAILITSSSDGVALVERATKKVLFWASAVNAHSAELLPGGLVAVAASHRQDQPGDRLILFAPGMPGRTITSRELPSGHGVVWDRERELLYALGYSYVRVFRLEQSPGTDADLVEVSRIDLPEGGGHELFPVPGTPYLDVSTSKRVWRIDRNTETVIAHPQLAERVRVKSISVNPRTGQTAWTEAEGDNWWTTKIRMLNPERVIHLPDRKIYKIRWLG